MAIEIHPRATWRPRYANGGAIIGTSLWVQRGKQVWLHHSVTNPPGPNATLEQDCAHMREFEAIGQSSFGQGISYTWVIMPSGRVFQGHDVDRQGAHTYGRNDESRAICFAGNFEVSEPTAQQLAACSQLLAQLGTRLSGGHRDVYATACPGRNAYDKIARINAAIGEEDDMPYTPQQLHDLIRVGASAALVEQKGKDNRNILDGVIQTRSELRDRAREAVNEALAPVVKELVTVTAQLTKTLAELAAVRGENAQLRSAVAELSARTGGPAGASIDETLKEAGRRLSGNAG